MLEDLNTSITGLQDDVAAKTAAIKESVDASNDVGRTRICFLTEVCGHV